MASAYKWKLAANKFAYITGYENDNPFIDDTAGVTMDDEAIISQKVNAYTEEEYKNQYERLKDIVRDDPDGRNVTMLSYKYYYNTTNLTCGFESGIVGPRGAQGVQGIPGVQGSPGADGRGIVSIDVNKISEYVNRVMFRMSDGENYFFDVSDGKDGISPTIDYSRVTQAVRDLNLADAISGNVASTIYSALTDIYNNRIEEAEQSIDLLRNELTGYTESVGNLLISVLSISGITEQLSYYIDTESSTINTISQRVSAVEGSITQQTARIDSVSGTVTTVESELNSVSATVETYVSRVDTMQGEVTEYIEKFDGLEGEYYRSIEQLTSSFDEFNGETDFDSDTYYVRKDIYPFSGTVENVYLDRGYREGTPNGIYFNTDINSFVARFNDEPNTYYVNFDGFEIYNNFSVKNLYRNDDSYYTVSTTPELIVRNEGIYVFDAFEDNPVTVETGSTTNPYSIIFNRSLGKFVCYTTEDKYYDTWIDCDPYKYISSSFLYACDNNLYIWNASDTALKPAVDGVYDFYDFVEGITVEPIQPSGTPTQIDFDNSGKQFVCTIQQPEDEETKYYNSWLKKADEYADAIVYIHPLSNYIYRRTNLPQGEFNGFYKYVYNASLVDYIDFVGMYKEVTEEEWKELREPQLYVKNNHFELSQITQAANGISAITTNSSGVSAGIIMSINDDDSNILIHADKVEIDGELIAKSITGETLSLGAADGTPTTMFYSDGSGFTANKSVKWDTDGNLTLGPENSTALFVDGSGYTANKNIHWNSNGDLYVGKNDSSAFFEDGSGYTANQGIRWESDGTLLLGGEYDYGLIQLNPDGSGFMADENFSWDEQGNITVNSVTTNGTMKSPFEYVNNGTNTGYSDNIIVISSKSQGTTYFIPNNGQDGRLIRVVNYKTDELETNGGTAYITMEGGAFFERDGSIISGDTYSRYELNSNEMVELLGYGYGGEFFGWIVLNRQRIGKTTEYEYGNDLGVMLNGMVTVRFKESGTTTCNTDTLTTNYHFITYSSEGSITYNSGETINIMGNFSPRSGVTGYGLYDSVQNMVLVSSTTSNSETFNYTFTAETVCQPCIIFNEATSVEAGLQVRWNLLTSEFEGVNNTSAELSFNTMADNNITVYVKTSNKWRYISDINKYLITVQPSYTLKNMWIKNRQSEGGILSYKYATEHELSTQTKNYTFMIEVRRMFDKTSEAV